MRVSRCPVMMDGIHSFDADGVCRRCGDLDPLITMVDDDMERNETAPDIVDRLREGAQWTASPVSADMREAADEIERLRAEVAELRLDVAAAYKGQLE